MHVRRDIDVHANISILKLRIDQRIDANAADSWLKRSGRDRHAVADFQCGLLPIKRANLRVLDEFRV